MLPNVCLECATPINPDETYCRRCLDEEGVAQTHLRTHTNVIQFKFW